MENLKSQQSGTMQQPPDCDRLSLLCAAECLDQRESDLNTCIKRCQICAAICSVCTQ